MKINFYLSIILLFLISCNKKEKRLIANNSGIIKNESELNPQYLKEIEDISKNPKIVEAFEFIKKNENETVQNQIALTKLGAPPFKEDKYGRPKLFKSLLEKYGIDSAWIDPVGNVIGLKKGSVGKNTLAITGHLDTVFPEETDVSNRIQGDTIYIPGIGDNGRGLTVLLTLLKTLDVKKITTSDNLLFIGNVGEEGLGDLRGMKELFSKRGPQIDYLIALEPGTRPLEVMDNGINVMNGGIGSYRYRVTFKGAGGHSWGSFGLANPAHAMSESISIFVKKANKFTKEGPKTSYNIGRLGGGTSVNSVPFLNWFEVDMRSVDPRSLEIIDSIFHSSIKIGLYEQNKIRKLGDSLSVTIEMIGNRPSGYTDPNNPLVQRGMASIKFMNIEPIVGAGSTDSNIPISQGVPAVTIGGGGEANSYHSLDEWYFNKDGFLGIQRLLLFVLAQTGGLAN